MKCKDCNSALCSYRTSDAKKNCFYESHPDYPMPRDLWNNDNTDWQALRNQAAIAAMQSFIGKFNINIRDSADCEKITKLAVEQADSLIKELKKK